MVRKAQIYQLKHSFSLFFPEYHGVFQFSFGLVLFRFVLFYKYFVKYLFFTLEDLSERLHGTGRSIRTIHIIFVTSLHDCKIVNTDYLLTLFYLEPRFHMESV